MHCAFGEERGILLLMKERIYLWDNLKFVLITCMVIGHFADEYVESSYVCRSIYLFLYAFHMPVFMFISGLFYRKGNVVKKCLFYCSLGYLQKIMFAVFDRIFTGTAAFDVFSDMGMPWFLFVLAIYTALMYFLQNVNSKYLLAFALVLACFAGYDKNIADFLYLSRTIVFFPFYLLGTMTDGTRVLAYRQRYGVKNSQNRKAALLIAGVCAVILLTWVYLAFARQDVFYVLRPLFTGRNPFPKALIPIGPLARALCYVITFLTGAAVVWLMPPVKLPGISRMGTHSLCVYFWHWIVYEILGLWISYDALMRNRAGEIVYFLIAIAISTVLSQGGIFSFPLLYLKKKIMNNENKCKHGLNVI